MAEFIMFSCLRQAKTRKFSKNCATMWQLTVNIELIDSAIDNNRVTLFSKSSPITEDTGPMTKDKHFQRSTDPGRKTPSLPIIGLFHRFVNILFVAQHLNSYSENSQH